jgi:hypothetical protein
VRPLVGLLLDLAGVRSRTLGRRLAGAAAVAVLVVIAVRPDLYLSVTRERAEVFIDEVIMPFLKDRYPSLTDESKA